MTTPTSLPSRHTRRTRHLGSLLAATLLAGSALTAQAAAYTFGGTIDFGGPIAEGTAYSGSLSFADQAADFSGSVELDSFTLAFNGYTYTLDTADLAPVAWFDAGSFLGVDYVDEDSDPLERAHVYLTAGFSALEEAFLMYTTANGSGFGSLTFTASGGGTVSEPASLTLALASLALLGGVARRRPRVG